jgi:hypothetical protein
LSGLDFFSSVQNTPRTDETPAHLIYILLFHLFCNKAGTK